VAEDQRDTVWVSILDEDVKADAELSSKVIALVLMYSCSAFAAPLSPGAIFRVSNEWEAWASSTISS
jgi:hypothetical protein